MWFICLLLDTFQKYLEVSFVFGLSIYTDTANTTVGNENVLVGFIFLRGGFGNILKKVGLQVILEKMKICSYLHVWKNPYPQNVS